MKYEKRPTAQNGIRPYESDRDEKNGVVKFLRTALQHQCQALAVAILAMSPPDSCRSLRFMEAELSPNVSSVIKETTAWEMNARLSDGVSAAALCPSEGGVGLSSLEQASFSSFACSCCFC